MDDSAERDRAVSGLSRSLARSGLSWDDRMYAAAVVFVSEALAPFWRQGLSASEAHERLRMREPEAAAAVEALAPLLLRRISSTAEATELIGCVEHLLGVSARR
ncbi:MAG: hypothetical protein AB7I38_13470 [Dehalococcoidia bacterium]